jgi:hypothetical protein
MAADETLRVLTWNLFHGRDGLPGLGATRRSTCRRIPEDDGVHMHVNRKLTGLMARRIASWAPDVCALQEVPTGGIREIVALTGMRAVWTTTGPLIGPARLRDALAARNPDLWRSHEGNANVLLLAPGLRVEAGSARSVRLNPLRAILRAARELDLEAGELVHYLPETRRLVVARIALPGGGCVAVGCTHCHNARHPGVVGREILRAAAAVSEVAGAGPAVLAGDLNARPSHPAIAELGGIGWEGAAPVSGMGIDRILHRGLRVEEPARRMDPDERDAGVWWRGVERRVRLSDHDPVIATFRVRASAS